MADGYNRVIACGNLGADPELRFTQGGQPVLNMRMACTESWIDKDGGGKKERTEWINVVVWGKRGEGLSKILSKGDRILIEGGLRTSEYDDREGNKRYKTDVHATDVVLCGGGARAGGESSRRDEPRRESSRRDEPRRESSRRDEPRRDEPRRESSRRDDSKSPF